jgi:hypothetical protein
LWTIIYPALGTFVGPAVGSQVTYQRVSGGDNIVLVEDYHGRTANQVITQSGVLIIIPNNPALPGVPVPQGGTQPFSATGGEPPYYWTTSVGSLGTIDASGLYSGNTSTNAGSNLVTVWDSAGNSDASWVDQQ